MVAEFYALHPMWSWLIIAAVILAVEIATGTGWLLWPAACAAVVAAVALTRVLNLPIEVGLFAVLSIASSLTAKRYLRVRDTQPGDDINDRSHHLVGKVGQVTGTGGGHIRVLVDGAEWEADSGAEGLDAGARVKVTKVLGGTRVRVEAI